MGRTGVLNTCRYGLLGVLLLLSACYSTGNNFSSAGLAKLQPGISTYHDVVALLEADPVNTYYHTNGTYMARWAHINSLLPDAIYMDRELWLDFDAQNYFLRIVKRKNVQIPLENTPQVEY